MKFKHTLCLSEWTLEEREIFYHYQRLHWTIASIPHKLTNEGIKSWHGFWIFLTSDHQKNSLVFGSKEKMYKNDIFSIKGKRETLESLPQAKACGREENNTASSEEEDNYFMLWQFLDSSEIFDQFDFFKNAGKCLREEKIIFYWLYGECVYFILWKLQ